MKRAILAALSAGLVLAQNAPAFADSKKVLVLAASSLTDVLPVVGTAWKAKHPDDELVFSFDGSSRLARQIEAGAPADLFLSADEEWVDELHGKGLLDDTTRRDLAGNELVVIVPGDAGWVPRSANDLVKAKKLALAAENVPVARYARASLEKLGLWKKIESKLVRGDNVRATLKWVLLGEADAGIVYRTDALAENKVKVAFALPASSHPPIRYAAAVLKGAQSPGEARSFLEFCAGDEARPLWRKAGFKDVPGKGQ